MTEDRTSSPDERFAARNDDEPEVEGHRMVANEPQEPGRVAGRVSGPERALGADRAMGPERAS